MYIYTTAKDAIHLSLMHIYTTAGVERGAIIAYTTVGVGRVQCTETAVAAHVV